MDFDIFPNGAVHSRTSRFLRLRQLHLRSGFSFAEVMFAVVILGIGFILIAAIFPIATEQTRSNNDQAIAAQLARDAIKTVQSSTSSQDYPNSDGVLRAFSDVTALWNKVAGSVIDPSDSRYAWVPFYSRNSNDGIVRISILVVRRWTHDVYNADDLTGDLMPRGISIMSITDAVAGNRTVQIARDPLGMYQSVTDGSFLLMRSGDGDFAGRTVQISRLTAEDADSVSYTLVPGDGFAPDESCGSGAAAVIGRDLTDSTNPDAGYVGPSQDIAVYTTLMSPN